MNYQETELGNGDNQLAHLNQVAIGVADIARGTSAQG